MRNFIKTTNPFSISPPPAWFLTQLFAFDPDLVLFASVESPCYQVAKRLHYTRHCRPSQRYPDTMVFAVHNLHPVGRLLPSPFTIWGPQVIADLKAMSVAEVGGGDKAADILDGFDQAEEAAFDVQLDGCLDWWGGDAWRYLTQKHHDQAKKGKRQRSVPSIGKLRFKTATGGSAVFVGNRHRTREQLSDVRAGRRDVDVQPAPPKIVADVVW